MLWSYVSVGLLGVANALIGGYVWAKNPRKALNRAFFLFAAGSALISIGMVLLFASHLLIFDRITFAGGFLMIGGLVLLSLKFPGDERLKKNAWIIFLPLIALAATVPGGFLVKEVNFRPDGVLQPVNGPGIYIFALVICAYVIFSVYQFWTNYRKLSGQSRLQMQYLALGAGVFAVAILVFNIILPVLNVFDLNMLGPASSSVFVVLTAYAIIRHRLLSVKVVVRRAVTYSVLALAFISFYLVSVLAFGALAGGYLNIEHGTLIFIGFVTACLGLLAAFALGKIKLLHQEQQKSKELEIKVAERTSALARSQEEKRQVMLDISHHLQTPLTVIKNELDFIKQHDYPSGHLLAFERSVDHISEFIYRLLELARLDDLEESSKEVVDFSALLKELFEYFMVMADQRKIKIKADISSDLFVHGNKEQLEKMVTNIVSNAFKYLDDERTGEVSLKSFLDGNRVVLDISDNGRGIAPDELENIFQRFYRGGSASQGTERGVGLGLAISKKIAEKHKGDISITSQLDQGTSMVITLPIICEFMGAEGGT